MCIDICPVGALTSGTYRYKTRPWEMKYVSTVCAHCSNGCKTTLSVRNNEILRANNRDLSGINGDFLCVKGRFGFDFAKHPERVKQPLIRRNGKLVPASWEDAMGEAARRLVGIHETHGPGAIGFIGSNRTSNEENYSLGASRAPHSARTTWTIIAPRITRPSSPRSGRAGAPMATMGQLHEARAILLVGNDPTEQNPLVAWQIRAAMRHHGARLYVINSQDIRLRRKAEQFVRVAAGTEADAVRRLATGKGPFDAAIAAALVSLKAAIEQEADVILVFGAEITGAAIRDLVTFGSSLKGRSRYIALGGYANSRGAADMGLLPDRLPGYAPVHDPAARDSFGKLWGATLPSEHGLSAREMLDAAASGKLKALYVVGSNPLKTFGVSAERLASVDLLVVHEMFMTETAQHADIILPASCAYEKDGTVTNTSGEVQLLRKAADVMNISWTTSRSTLARRSAETPNVLSGFEPTT